MKEDKGLVNAIGRANKYLHWQDILYFKEKGMKSYDWGGCGEEEAVANISSFKRKFGGKEMIVYDGITANNRIGKLACYYLKIKNRISLRKQL